MKKIHIEPLFINKTAIKLIIVQFFNLLDREADNYSFTIQDIEVIFRFKDRYLEVVRHSAPEKKKAKTVIERQMQFISWLKSKDIYNPTGPPATMIKLQNVYDACKEEDIN